MSYGNWEEADGAAAHLGINVAAIIGSGMAVLAATRRRRLDT